MEKSVIIGHSHLKYFDNYIKDESTKVITHSGCLVEELILFLDVRKAVSECGVIVVHCGINNLPKDEGEVLFQKFMSLFHNIQKLNPRAQVVMSQILPRSQNDKPRGRRLTIGTLLKINHTATYVNQKLVEAAQEIESLNFVYHPGFYDEEVTYILKRKMLSADGLHLSFEGTSYIVSNIERAINFAKFLLRFSGGKSDTAILECHNVACNDLSKDVHPSCSTNESDDQSNDFHLNCSTISSNLKTSTVSSDLKSSTISSDLKSSTITSDLKSSTITSDLKSSTITSDLKCSTISSDLKSSTISSDLKSSTISSDLNCSTIPSDLKSSTISSDLKSSTISSDLKSSTISSDLKSSTISSDLKSSTITSDLKSSTITSDLKSSTFSSDLKSSTISSDLKSSTISSDLKCSTVTSDLKCSTVTSDDLSIDVRQNNQTIFVNSESQKHRLIGGGPQETCNDTEKQFVAEHAPETNDTNDTRHPENDIHVETLAMEQSNIENNMPHSEAANDELTKDKIDNLGAVLYKKFEEHEKFDYVEALRIFVSPDRTKVSTIAPYHPEGRTVYLFSGENDDWKADGYTWRYNGKKEKVISGVTVTKIYFHIRNGNEKSSKFRRSVYQMSGPNNSQNLKIVVYEGDNAEYKAMPHGNSKSENARPFQRTLPSVLSNLKSRINENPADRQNAKELHNKIRSELPFVLNPRNTKQIRNIQASVNRTKRLSHDSLYNLHELYYHLDGYIAEIKTLPDLHVIVAHPEVISEFDRLIQIKGDDAVCLFYDTTFETGDFYISTLSFKHFMFENGPVIPLSFMIHERRKQKCHEAHFSFLKERIPRLQKRPVPVVTDREQGIVNAFKNVLPDSHIFLCWNHILRDVEFWVKKKGAAPKEIRFYKDEVKLLLQCESENEYLEMFEQRKSPWSKPFLEYFEGNLQAEIMENAGRWLLEEFNVYNPYSGITNNASESMNAKLKRLLDWKEKDVDTIVLYLYYWQNNDLHDMMSGFCDVGDFCLRTKFKDLKKDLNEVDIVAKSCHPDEIISLVKGSIENLVSTCPPQVPLSEPERKEEKQVEKKDENSCMQTEIKVSDHPSQDTKSAIQVPEHLKIVHGRSIALVPEMAAFVVKGLSGKNYAVTLFPKESCQCPSTRRCCHIQAARVSIGLDAEENKRKVVNLTQLIKNARPRKFKKSGRKRPLDDDLAEEITVVPAPDSILAKSLNESVATGEFPDEEYMHSTPKRAKAATPKTPKSILKNKPKAKNGSNKKIRFNAKLKNLNKTFAEGCSPVKSDPTSDQCQDTNLNCSMEQINADCSFEEMRQDDDLDDDYWIKELFLKERERIELTQNKKLTSYHMEAVNIISREQFSNIHGFQLTEKVPNYIKTEKRWNVDSVMNSVSSPACQIHHTGADHWVVSFQDNEENIFVFDSLGNERSDDNILTDSLKLQLAVVYGGSKQSLHITVPDTHRQSNGVDCGLYAIAHLTEFCFQGRPMPNVIFDTAKMRSHLVLCLENQKLSEFPKTNKLLNTRRKRDVKTFNVPLYCICTLPSCLDIMTQCKKCKNIFHRSCVFSPSCVSQEDFCCVSCT